MKTTMPSDDDFRVAYMDLLQVTAQPDRALYCQRALAVLRDYIASVEGKEPEVVQNVFETKAALAADIQKISAH